MKKLYLCALTLMATLLLMQQGTAQGIYQFWGVTGYGGGDDDQGALFSARYDGKGIKKRDAFEIYTPGGNLQPRSFETINGKVYSFMDAAGPNMNGSLYEFDPATNTYTKKLDLITYPIYSNDGFMYSYNNKLYGKGTYNSATWIYEYDPATNTILFKKEIDPYANNFILYNNKLYGTTYLGGLFDDGYIFSLDPVTYTFTKLLDLPDGTGNISKFQVFNNRLYAVDESGGLNGGGAIMEYNPATNQLTEKESLVTAGGKGLSGELRLFNNKFYGVTNYGLFIDEPGVLFEYDPVQNIIVKKRDISDLNPISSLEVLYNNRFYGVSYSGGNFDKGVLYEYDPQTNVYTKKIHFTGLPGERPHNLLTVIGGNIFGITAEGGSYTQGTIYAYNFAANTITKRVDLGHNNGYRPYGKMVYFQGKLYGFTTKGGNRNLGVIYSYDLATHTYQVHHHMNATLGFGNREGSMIVYNNKLYGVAGLSENPGGVLFEFDPNTNMYAVRHQFTSETGYLPAARPLLYNNKFYGVTTSGGSGDGGVLYEYDPATDEYSVKVNFSGSFGSMPYAPLSVFNGKLYGSCRTGGANGNGTLFEYNPAFNGITIKHHFTEAEGSRSSGALALLNNKFYGTLDLLDFENFFGSLYEFDPVSGAFAIEHKFTYPEGSLPDNELAVHNNKLYGLTAGGGNTSVYYGGTFYEYDPVSNKYSQQSTLNYEIGRFPEQTGLTLVPALVAPGNPGSCKAAGAALINAANASQWIPFTDEEGNAVMEINANGNVLGTVRVEFYTHNGPVRKDEANRFYLDRNITVNAEHQPATPVSVRLYIRKTEFETLKNTEGTGVQNVSDITVFKNGDQCSNSVDAGALPITSSVTTWGLDYVYTAQITSFSTFYFASKAYSALPVKLEYFKGNAEANSNKLQWKAGCTDNADFIVERSTDGVTFNQIGMVMATSADCSKPFTFPDQQPVPGKGFYRLQMKDEKGVITISQIITIDRSNTTQLIIQLNPNPVQGGVARFSIQSPQNSSVPLSIYDASGRVILQTSFAISKGSQYKELDLQRIPTGVYTAVFNSKDGVQPIRFVKK